MSDPNHQPQRSATRAPVERPVRLQFDDSIDVEEGLCGNVSIGGMFATVPSARPPGTLVRFELVLSDEESVRGLGEVIWMKPAPAGVDGGMGIKFRFLEQPDRQMIFRLVSQHIKERLAGSGAPAAASAAAAGQAEADDPNPTDQILLTPETDEELAPFPPPPTLPEIDLAPPTEAPELAEPALPEPALPEPAIADPGLPEPDAPWSVIDTESDPAFDADLGLDSTPEPDETGSSSDSGDRVAVSAGDLALDAGYQSSALDQTDGDAAPDPYSRSARVRRSRPELSWPLILVALIAVAAVAATVYLFRERLFSALDPPPPVVEPAVEDGVDPAVEDGVEDGAQMPPAGADMDADPEPARVDPAPPPPPARTPPPPAPPAAAPVATPGPGPGSFGRLVDIGWSLQQTGVRVAIATDGTIDPDRFTHFRLEGGSPREVIVLRGVAEPYGRSQIPVGSDIVSGIRTGFHRKAGGNELHVVIDLADPRAQVAAIRNLGRRLEIDVGL